MAKVVLGAMMGDECKGILTNHLCEQTSKTTPALNIRIGGGANCGHTAAKDGIRHVFHHFGAGSLHNHVETFLSQHFVSNPFLFKTELQELFGKRVFPRVYVDARSLLTTHYDMMINQLVEESRGSNRHGSCGVGLGETIERSEKMMPIFISETADAISKKLALVKNEWVPARLKSLGITPNQTWQARLDDVAITDSYIGLISLLKRKTHIVYDVRDLISGYDPENIIMEGNQGLLLDQNHKWFPYVTRSNTGVKNAVEIASEAGLRELDVTFCFRWYATRHGAGPFPSEVIGMSFPDETNVPNDWQGTLRFGHLDLDLLLEAISNDIVNADGVKIRANLAVTCLDQIEKDIPYVIGGEIMRANTTLDFLNVIRRHIGLPINYTGYLRSTGYRIYTPWAAFTE